MKRILPPLLILGCAVEPDPEMLTGAPDAPLLAPTSAADPGVDALVQATTDEGEDEDEPCLIEDEPQRPAATSFAAAVEIGEAPRFDIEFHNPLDEAGRYRVVAGVFTAEGSYTVADVEQGQVEPAQTVALSIAAPSLSLPATADEATVSLTVLATFSDGHERVMGDPLYAELQRSPGRPPRFRARLRPADGAPVTVERTLAQALRGRSTDLLSTPSDEPLLATVRQLDAAVVPHVTEPRDLSEPDPDTDPLDDELIYAPRLPPLTQPLRVDADPRDVGVSPAHDFLTAVTKLQARGLDVDAETLSAPPTPVGANPTVQFCLEIETQYDDAGGGETRWTSPNPIYRDVPGLLLQVQRWFNGAWYTVWMDYTGDGIGAGDPGVGCTGPIPGGPAFFRFTVWSESNVQGNAIKAEGVVPGGTVPVQYPVAQWKYVTSGKHDIEVSTGLDEILNVLSAASYGLYRHAGGLHNGNYDIEVGGNSTALSGGVIKVSNASADEKFKILHEVGHAIGSQTTGGVITGSNYSRFASSCPNFGPGSHSLTSYEYSEAAANEGFAHFYAADVFNTHGDDAGCWFGYYKPEWNELSPVWVSCESSSDWGSTTFGNAFYEDNCLQNDGRGVELDWMRQFWDVHTNSSSHPSFTEIVNWLDSAAEPSVDDAYQVLHSAAFAWGGSLWSIWWATAGFNGIDH
ncbi:MAG: hypothetical protein K0V04_37125 [Deltaproteobacteria bacterium]|nr:hypothetical protein [Deltaproteobacteria bacterium]